MDARIPLPALLSQALVAFTIEFDNEAEHRLPHRMTSHGSTSGSLHAPWRVSMVMWFNCMRFVDEKGVTAGELERLARAKANLNGMQRWGYVSVAPDPADKRPKPPRSAWLIRATRGGKMAREIWQPLLGVIENRWEERFGKTAIDDLRNLLRSPSINCSLICPTACRFLAMPLASLLAKPLLAIAIEFEGESEVSLAISANVLRLAGDEGIRMRELPRLAGVSREAIAVASSFLTKRGYAAEKPEARGSRVKLLTLTPKGRNARDKYFHLLPAIEERWEMRFGREVIRSLRRSLEALVGEPAKPSSLFRGLEPYPDGWRASFPPPECLPHYPMLLHRGDFPDGT